ncbi:MAG TPA: cation diffusion facilitator family transporter [Thermoanaerobaculia bacterium]|nr:cation diffusion facilitator family transporter [Thermoanaerobaculia bacterium]
MTISRKLMASAAATIAFLVVQLLVGLTAGSLALIGDALHNFTDALALLLALFAVRLERKPPNEKKSYGYHRAGILAAFVNAGTLVAFTIFIFIEAFERFSAPRAVNDTAMFVTAIAGIALNFVIAMALRHEGKRDVNVRSAVIHMVGDSISSAGIIVAAILIRVTGSTIWDPAVSVLIGILILWSSWGILRETINLLLEGTPRGIDPALVARTLATLDGVQGVHHLHIWALGPSRPALSCHLMVGDVPVKTTAKLLDDVNALLQREYNIVHSTVQFEYANCAEGDPYCIPYTERQVSER